MRTVRIGDRDITVEEPSIYKTELIGDRFAKMGKEAPEIQIELAQFVARYRRENIVTLDRASAKVQVPEIVGGLTESDWKQLGQEVKLPSSPSGVEIALAIMPTVFTKAKEQALEIVALLMVSDSSLETMSEAELRQAIDNDKKFLRYHAKLSELISLLSECTEVIKDVMDAHKEELGKLRSFWESIRPKPPQDERKAEAELAEAEAERLLSEAGVSQRPTDSQPDTDGDSERSPIESPSATLSPSSS